MKHKTNVPKIFIRKGRAYLNHEIIEHLTLVPGERLSILQQGRRLSLMIHNDKADPLGSALQVEEKQEYVGFYFTLQKQLPKPCYVVNFDDCQLTTNMHYMASLKPVSF